MILSSLKWWNKAMNDLCQIGEKSPQRCCDQNPNKHKGHVLLRETEENLKEFSSSQAQRSICEQPGRKVLH